MSVPDPAADPPLRLLGAPQLGAGERRVPFTAERPFLLLALLACRGDWRRRDELAELLYPGRELESARSNLRKVIFLARKVDGVGTIEQQGDLLRWAPPSDLQRFEAACDARRWGDAVAAYGGPLLLGLESGWPAGGADWLEAERQRLQSRWHEACTRRLAELAAEPEAAQALATLMLRHDPLDDTALEALGRAQQALGQRDAALAALADYTQRLAQEAGLAPSAALDALGEQLRLAVPAAPPPALALVGRRHERSQVLERLARPDCRVLTLLGPPGIGKSTLARSLQAELAATWVGLESLAQADEVPGRVAAALGATLDGPLPPWEALATLLAARPALLLLDNAEHLALAPGLATVLAAAPQLRVLAASRTPLGVPGEWRLPLDGLPLPDRDETDAEVLAANDAVRLFVERARPLAPGFELAAEAADVVRLVHEVDGLPLAIELLAAWRRLMPVADILAELADSLDLLEPSTPNERSVRAGFARAWQQLGPLEQRVLSQLALLPAPIDRALVRGALQAPLPVLAALADRSLLHADGQGRFSLHPLIRRLAAPLASEVDALHERHARHVARTLARAADAGDEQLPHLRAAWRWGVVHADVALLDALRPGYTLLMQRRALWREGIQAMDELAQLLRAGRPGDAPWPATGPAAQTGRLLASALNRRAGFCYQCGALDDALATAREAAALAQQLQEPALEASATSRIGAVCWQRGAYDAARAAFQRQAALAASAPDAAAEQARAEAWLALVDKAEADYPAALQRYDHAVRLMRESGRLPDHLYLLNNLGNLLRMLGREAQARQVLQEGLQLARAHGSLEDEPFLLTNIALVHEQQGDFAAAGPWAERAVASAAEHGEPMIEAAARLARARTLAALRAQVAPALPDVWAALSIASALRSPPLHLEALVGAGVVLAHGGRRDAALALLQWARSQAACSPAERADLDRHLLRLAPAGPDPAAAARLPPDATVDDAIALLRQAATP